MDTLPVGVPWLISYATLLLKTDGVCSNAHHATVESDSWMNSLIGLNEC